MLLLSSSARFSATGVGCAIGALAAMFVAAIAAPAFADAPTLALTVNAGASSKYQSFGPNSTVGGTGIYNGTVVGAESAWSVYYNLNAANSITTVDGAQTGASSWVNGSVAITNQTSSEVAYSISLTIPTDVVDAMWGQFHGSTSGTLITSGAGYIHTNDASPLWTGTTAGASIATLFDAPISVSRATSGATTLGSRSFGTPSLVSVPEFGAAMVMIFNFSLSAGDTASFTTGLNGVGFAVPAPGALALLGAAGAIGNRRRRR